VSDSQRQGSTSEDLKAIRRQADLLLRRADAYGRFPTPVKDLVACARLAVASGVSLDEGFLRRLYRNVRQPIRRAFEKVAGLLDTRDGTIYLDQTVVRARQNFVSLHEVGHGVLPWQRDAYALLEDGERSLDPDIQEIFEQQASIFAAEVLFQRGRFEKQCRDLPLELKTPINLARKYGASCYAAMRRYVSTHRSACAVFVFDQPTHAGGSGCTVTVRRTVESPSFLLRYGSLPGQAGAELEGIVKAMVASGVRVAAGRRSITLQLSDGRPMAVTAEAFNTTYQVLVLVIPEQELDSTKRKLWLPKRPSLHVPAGRGRG
jgi:hypothetical protein